MISSLQQIVLNYERTNEGKKAKEILDFLVPSKKKEADETKNKDTENKEQNPEPETTENETDIISINESETSAKIEEIPQETPKEEQKKQKPTKLERPVQSWEKQYLD